MPRSKKINKLELLQESLKNSLQYAKGIYIDSPTNEMYSIITIIESALKESQKIK